MKFSKIVCFTAVFILLCGQGFCNDTGLTITDSGYTGIGTDTPKNKLHIHNDENDNYLMRMSSGDAWGTRLLFQNVSNTSHGFSMGTGGTGNLIDSLYFSTMANDKGDYGVSIWGVS